MAEIIIPARPGHRDFTVGSYFEYEGTWYFRTGVFNAFQYFCEPNAPRKDPPTIKPDLRQWLVDHEIDLRPWEERGNLELVFNDSDVFTLFKLTWL